MSNSLLDSTALTGPMSGWVGLPNFPLQCQELSNWCWCAMLSSLTQLFPSQARGPKTQLDIFEAYFTDVSLDCSTFISPGQCAVAVGNACDSKADFASVCANIGAPAIPCLREDGIPAFSTLKTYLDSAATNRSCPIGLVSLGGYLHVVAITAYAIDSANNYLRIADPLSEVDGGFIQDAYENLVPGYRGRGTWQATYYVGPMP